MQSKSRLLGRLLFVAALVAVFALRWRVVGEFHAPAGDGIGYHQLAHEFHRAGRFAYGPSRPLAYARMPGWPILVAALDPGEGNDIETVLIRVTHLNVLFDFLTALLLFLIAREAKLFAGTKWVALALVLLWPLFILDSCYLLRESLSTTIVTFVFYLIARAQFRRDPRFLVAASAVIGLGMLVRVDMIGLGVACVPAWLSLSGGWRRKLRVAVVSAFVCAICFAPWPLRNLIQFGHFYPAKEIWIDVHGDPLPTGEREWLGTWNDDINQGWSNLRLVNHLSVTERDVAPQAYDSTDEKREVLALFARYNKEGLSPAVDHDFHALAMRRFAERPLYRLVYLPLRRAVLWWWLATPAYEQPLRSRTLHQPEWRFVFEYASRSAMVLGLLGWALLLAKKSSRGFALAVALALVVRTLAISFLAPNGDQRYVAPTYPMLLLGVAFLVAAAASPLFLPRAQTPD